MQDQVDLTEQIARLRMTVDMQAGMIEEMFNTISGLKQELNEVRHYVGMPQDVHESGCGCGNCNEEAVGE